MEELGLPLLIHGESTDPAIDVFDREKAFIEEVLGPTVERFASLKVVLEHITTREAVQYVEVTGPNVAATITAHHLLMNRNALFMGGIRPHHYCLPVLKREEHREALVRPRLPASGSSSSAPTARRTVGARRAAVLSTTVERRVAVSLGPRGSASRPRRSSAWKASRASSARGSTACRRTKAPSP
jgi:dihydroorotase (homodimeric type)